MKYFWLSIVMCSLTLTTIGCGGGAEVEEEAEQQMDQLSQDPEYQQQMEGTAAPDQ